MSSAAVPSRVLTSEEERTYVPQLLRILRAARLNLHFPDVRQLSDHLSVLDPRVHQGLYEGVQVDLRSGLPTYREWTRAQTDVSLAQEMLQQLGDRKKLEQRAPQSAIHAKQLKKYDYYQAIQKKKLAELGGMKVQLRRVETATKTAYFHIIFDKLDASGVFVRYSIDLAQQDSFWSETVVALDEEASKQTQAFQSLIYKFTSLDAEHTYVKLIGLEGLSVERVVKGTIGPFCYASGLGRAPDGIELEDGFVAMFSLSMVALDITEDRANDPFEDLLLDTLTQHRDVTQLVKETHAALQKEHGYHVFKDRKFVVPRGLLGTLRQLTAARGTKNMIYTV